MKKIIMFHGQECPHCQAMQPIVDQLIANEICDVEKFEIWHNNENADKMRAFSEIIIESCGDLSVPTFLDVVDKRATCGEMSYENLKKWINKE